MELLGPQIEIVDYNLRDSKLETIIELGLLEVLKRCYYKIGVFYGESVTLLTIIQEKNYRSQMLGVKLGFGLLKS